MLGPAPDARELESLTVDVWAGLGAIAAQHRLLPHLYARLSRGELQAPVPEALRIEWQAAHRDSAIRALAQRREIRAAAALLVEAGLEPVALKGAWLAWRYREIQRQQHLRLQHRLRVRQPTVVQPAGPGIAGEDGEHIGDHQREIGAQTPLLERMHGRERRRFRS